MDLNFSSEQQGLRTSLRALLDRVLPDDWVGVWNEHNGRQVSRAAVEELAAKGWLTMHWPVEYGGQGASVWHQAVIQEELFARHEPRGGQYMGVNWIGPVIIKFGTEDQKQKLLPEIAQGRVQWAQLYSEPDAGSDLAHLKTRASLHGDHFVVNGEKIWTSYADTATRGFLLARTDPAEKAHKGISALLIDMNTPGITVREIPSAVGWHRFHSVSFSDVVVPRSALLGQLNGGWSVAMASLPFERLGNARYARATRILGHLENIARSDESLDEDKAIADCLAFGRATELMNYEAIAINDAGQDLSWHASAAFAMNANYERLVAELCEEIVGSAVFVAAPDSNAVANGEVESFAVRQAPTVTIQAGTYQIQLSQISTLALRFPRGR